MLRDFVAFLRQPTIQQDSPLEWFVHVSDVLLSKRIAARLDKGKLLAAFAGSGDPVMRLYAELEKLLPPPQPAAPAPAKSR